MKEGSLSGCCTGPIPDRSFFAASLLRVLADSIEFPFYIYECEKPIRIPRAIKVIDKIVLLVAVCARPRPTKVRRRGDPRLGGPRR